LEPNPVDENGNPREDGDRCFWVFTWVPLFWHTCSNNFFDCSDTVWPTDRSNIAARYGSAPDFSLDLIYQYYVNGTE
jgi:hypothetical protein